MPDSVQDKVFYWIIAAILSIAGWAVTRTYAHDAQLQAIQYQIQAIVQQNGNTISPVVEASLREIREKTNAQADAITKLTEAALDNRKEIGFLKERAPK
jgi:hypothetical protein